MVRKATLWFEVEDVRPLQVDVLVGHYNMIESREVYGVVFIIIIIIFLSFELKFIIVIKFLHVFI